jgi:hypothetical protein
VTVGNVVACATKVSLSPVEDALEAPATTGIGVYLLGQALFRRVPRRHATLSKRLNFPN